MSGLLTHLTPATAVAAIEANLRACLGSFRQLPDASLREDADLFSVVTGVPANFFNGLVGARFVSGDVDARIAQAVAPFQARAAPFRWWLTPSTQPPELGPLLEAHGLAHALDAPGMAVDLARLPERPAGPAGLTVEHVRDVAGLKRWVAVFSAGFGRSAAEAQVWFDVYAGLGLGPDAAWQHYVGLVDGQPVATSSLLMGGGVAGIYHVVTLPPWRGRGIGTAVTLEPLRVARALGYRVGVLQSSELGLSVYRGLGFQAYCELQRYSGQPPMAAGAPPG